MPHVDMHNILTEEDALSKIQDIFSNVENNKESYVITRNGRPAIAIIDIETFDAAPNTPNSAEVVSAAPAFPIQEPVVQEEPAVASAAPQTDELPPISELPAFEPTATE